MEAGSPEIDLTFEIDGEEEPMESEVAMPAMQTGDRRARFLRDLFE